MDIFSSYINEANEDCHEKGVKKTHVAKVEVPTHGISTTKGNFILSFCLVFIGDCRYKNVSFIGVIGDDKVSHSCVDEYEWVLAIALALPSKEAARAADEQGTRSFTREGVGHDQAQLTPTQFLSLLNPK